MKAKVATSCLVIGALLTPYFVHADDSDTDRKHPATYVKDSTITTKVKAKLATEKIASLAHISVDTDNNGAVVLTGNVQSQAEADKAVAIAKGTEGVSAVTSKLQVKKDK